MLTHVGPDPGGDVMIDRAHHLDSHTVLFHDAGADIDQALGVA